MDAGYSGTPLPKKLNLPPAGRLLLLNVPTPVTERIGAETFDTEIDPDQIYDWMLIHSISRQEVESLFPRLKAALSKKGCLWFAWPKKASGVQTDLNENIIRDIGLAAGLVDTKVCAIDETWSGLKFMWRLVDR